MTRRARPIRCRLRAPCERAFTVIEVMLALALSAVVIAAAIGMYRILGAAERTSQARFEQAADLAVAQVTLRRIMNTLVCAPAQPADQTSGRAQAQVQPEDDQEAADEDDTSETGEEEDGEDRAAILGEAAPATPIMFDLWWEEMEMEFGTAVVPVIELVVSEPPIALTSAGERVAEEDLNRVDDAHAEEALRRANRLAETVRGVIEVVPDLSGWRLQWRPINPPAMAFPLVSRIATLPDGGPDLTWEVLSRDDKNTTDPWKDIWAAKTHAEFPQAVHLYFTTTDSTYTDWLFETHDTVQE